MRRWCSGTTSDRSRTSGSTAPRPLRRQQVVQRAIEPGLDRDLSRWEHASVARTDVGHQVVDQAHVMTSVRCHDEAQEVGFVEQPDRGKSAVASPDPKSRSQRGCPELLVPPQVTHVERSQVRVVGPGAHLVDDVAQRLGARSGQRVRHSHSMVPGGFAVTSRATRLTSATSLVIRVEIFSSTS